MKRVLILLGLMTLAVRGIAQSGIPDMPFFINFSPLYNSPSNSVLRGVAEYNRVKQFPAYFPPPQTYTNSLEVYIGLPAIPEHAWILEKEKDGSFNRVFELTNIFSYYGVSYSLIFDQFFTLTPRQIYSLIEGNWYAEVDFGASNYLGNLAPQYAFSPGPKVVIDIPPFLGQPSNAYWLISPNNRTARLVLDGSQCVDPFYLPMHFSWAGWTEADFDFNWTDPIFTDTGMFAVHVFPLGSYIIGLQVNDPIVNGKPYYFPLQVITAGQAVDMIIPNIQNSGIPDPQKQVLIRELSTAETLFNRGYMARGCFELKVCQRFFKSLHLDSTVTDYFDQQTQDIIDAFRNQRHHEYDDHRYDPHRHSGKPRR